MACRWLKLPVAARQNKKRNLAIPAQAGIPSLRLRGEAGGGNVPFGTVLWVPDCAGTTVVVNYPHEYPITRASHAV